VNLQRLFDPGAIAVVGASRNEAKIGHAAMANATAADVPVYPVNPTASGELFGESFVDSVGDVGESVDLALVCVPAPVVPEVIDDCGEAGVGAAVVYSGGFAESGANGDALQRRLVAAADRHDMAVLGPNTSGFVVPGSDLTCSFVDGVRELPPGDVAVVAQSGGVAHDFAFRAIREGRGLSAMVGLGNRANVGFAEAIEYFDAHAATDAIVLHVEGTDDARGLLEVCRGSETPVVAYKVGRSDVGAFAASHTGALTGDHELYEAGFAQYGVPTVDSTAALLDAGVALAREPDPSGPNVGVVTAQAGPGIIAADRIQRAGGRLPELGEETRNRLADLLPEITYAGNPVDTGRPMPAFGDVVAAVAADDAVDVVLVYELFESALGLPVETLRDLVTEEETPVLFATAGPPDAVTEDAAALRDAGVPVYFSPERGADAAATLARYATLSATTSTDGGDDDRDCRDDQGVTVDE
jgi:acetyltransferase